MAFPMPTGKIVRSSGSSGYTFPIMLIIVSVLAFGAVRMEITSRYRLKRDREEELLFRGRAYMVAIEKYYIADDVMQRRHYPKSFDDLISDSRFDGRSYIRQLYKDPMTGADFKPILASDQSILGVVSQGKEAPLKTADFPKDLPDFDKAKTYEDWQFHSKNITMLQQNRQLPGGASPGPKSSY